MPSTEKDDHDPFNTKRPEVFELSGWRWWVFHPVAWLLRIYLRTIRFRIDQAMLDELSTIPSPRMYVMWHNRSFLSPEMFRRFFNAETTATLISPSRMAAWQVAFFDLFKFQIVRGSTTRRSIQAGIELLKCMREGNDAGISPDGPSGPLYSFQEGSVAIARKASAPLVILMPNCTMAYRSKNWDRTLWPLPFMRADITVKIVPADDPLWSQSNAEVAKQLRRICLDLTKDPFALEDLVD